MKIDDITEFYRSIIDNYFGAILVSDADGNIFFVNKHSDLVMPHEQLIQKNMYKLVEEGIYGKSATLEALQTKKATVRNVSRKGRNSIVTTSVPILDEMGDIKYVVAYSLNEAVTYELIEKIEDEKNNALQLIDYLSQKDLNSVRLAYGDEKMRLLVNYARKVAGSDSTVLLTGESGTGKDVFAQFIHANSRRKDGIYIPINCAAIPGELLEAEFFGYVKGSFTGAKVEGKAGLFELAQNGTLFLDEIAEMPLSLQSKLLRALDCGEVKRIGSEKVIKVNVRVLAATNRDLTKMVKNGLFREELYYRINVIPIAIPPIRERKNDIIVLANTFLEGLNRKYSTRKFFAPETIKDMCKYDWPGNAREIKNVVERAYITSASSLLYLQSTIRDPQPEVLDAQSERENDGDFDNMRLKDAVKRFEEERILTALQTCKGNISMTANKLGITRASLYKKIAAIKRTNLGNFRK